MQNHTNYWSSKHRFFYHSPPTAIQITLNDLWIGIQSLYSPNRITNRFSGSIQDYLNVENCILTSSGRAALTIILTILKKSSRKSEVIIPAYGCPTVAQSILKADLTPVFCDVCPDTIDFNRDNLISLITNKTLAIIPTHLYGLALDISDLMDIGQSEGIYIIEDAAQAFGTNFNGQMIGTNGDFGFFSMGRGKCLPTGSGGFIIFQDQFEAQFKSIKDRFQDDRKSGLVDLIRYAAYGIAVHPVIWWIIVRTSINPASDAMDIHELPGIKIESYSSTQAGIGSSILKRIHLINNIRRDNAQKLILIFKDINYVSIPEVSPLASPTFLRFPVICHSKEIADKFFCKLNKSGIGVSRSYYRTIPDIFRDQMDITPSDFPGAIHLAECLLTLPTHDLQSQKDLEIINQTLDFVY